MLDQEAHELFSKMTQEIDQSIRELDRFEDQLISGIDGERVDELDEFWSGLITAIGDQEDFRRSMCYREKKLLWVWARLRKLRGLRFDVTQDFMKMNVTINED